MLSSLQCYSDMTHKLVKYLAEEKLITIKISGGEDTNDPYFYKVYSWIRRLKDEITQPGQYLKHDQ